MSDADNNLINEIKNLKPFEIFDYIDGPRFYSCLSSTGEIYLSLWLSSNENATEWAYVAISKRRYNAVKCGNISIRSAMSSPEKGVTFLVTAAANDAVSVRIINDPSIIFDLLPHEDERLNLPTSDLDLPDCSTSESAASCGRDVLDVSFDKQDQRKEISLAFIGEFFVKIQLLAHALGWTEVTRSRRIPDRVLDNTLLSFSSAYRGSVGVRLKATNPKLIDLSANDEFMDRFVVLIASLKDARQTLANVQGLNLLARIRFRSLLTSLRDAQVSLQSSWSSPFGQTKSASASYSGIANALVAIAAREEIYRHIINLSGTLDGLVNQDREFIFISDDGEKYSGKFSENMKERSYKVPSRVSVQLEEEVKDNQFSGQENWTYTLLKITPLD